jgi:hypothetical protein
MLQALVLQTLKHPSIYHRDYDIMKEEKLEPERVSTIKGPFVISTNETLGYVMNGKTRIPFNSLRVGQTM